jgi:hypothetical protein
MSYKDGKRVMAARLSNEDIHVALKGGGFKKLKVPKK